MQFYWCGHVIFFKLPVVGVTNSLPQYIFMGLFCYLLVLLQLLLTPIRLIITRIHLLLVVTCLILLFLTEGQLIRPLLLVSDPIRCPLLGSVDRLVSGVGRLVVRSGCFWCGDR